jgi:hypothetical protein
MASAFFFVADQREPSRPDAPIAARRGEGSGPGEGGVQYWAVATD